MTKKNKKYRLPENFYRIMKKGNSEEIKAVFADKEYVNGLIESNDFFDYEFNVTDPEILRVLSYYISGL